MKVALALVVACSFAIPAHAKRSYAAKQEFRQAHVCPSTGKSKGPCPGWTVDHVMPICHGGADAAYNMQWQTKEEAKAKDQWECR